MEHPLNRLPQPIGILADGGHSTKAYWLEGAQAKHDHPELIHALDPTKQPAWRDIQFYRSIVVVRTVPRLWITSLKALKKHGTTIALLLDDSLLDVEAINEQRLGYRWKLWFGITRHRNNLESFFSELWVTTPRLMSICKHYSDGANIKLRMMPLHPLVTVVRTGPVFRIAYLGTASHGAEIRWILLLLQKLQKQRSDCLLELILPSYWRRKYRSVPRTRLFYPMDWETYLADTGNRQVDILLVPLLPSRFNAGRSATKFFEAARLGAAGLYSQRSPYDEFIRHNIDGLLVPDADEYWLSAINRLLNEPEERRNIAARCRQRAIELCTPQVEVEWQSMS